MGWATGFDGASLKVEIGFGSAPTGHVGSTSWTDVTVDVRSANIKVGRSSEFDDYQPGTATIVLNNRNRQYDPSYSAGAHFAALLPMKRIRISMTYAATTVVLYTGHVLGWPQAYDKGAKDATVTINCADGFVILSNTELPSYYEYFVRAEDPILWLRFGEVDGDIAVDSSGNARDGSLSRGFDLTGPAAGPPTGPGLLVGSSSSLEFVNYATTADQTGRAPVVGGTVGGTQVVVGSFPWPGLPFTIEMWLNTRGAPGEDVQDFLMAPVRAEGGGNILQIDFTTADFLEAFIQNSAATYTLSAIAVGGGVTLCDGKPHHVVATFSSSAAKLYLDSSLLATGSPVGGGSLGSGTLAFTLSYFGAPTAYLPYSGYIDELAVYPSEFALITVQSHYAKGIGDTAALSGIIADGILDGASWPATPDRAMSNGISDVNAGDIGGKKALDVIKSVERSEQGRFFINGSGVATFLDRYYTVTLASVATFGDSGSELRYSDIGFDYSRTFIRNKIIASREGGQTYTVSDAASIVSYYESTDSLTGLLNTSDRDVTDIADYRLANYKDPRQRITKLEIKPRRSPTTLYPQVRDRKLVELVTVLRRPQSVGTAISQDVIIEGIEHDIGADGEWTTTFLLSPAETSSGSGFGFAVIDTSLVGSARLGA